VSSGWLLREPYQAKPSASSFAACSAVIPGLGSPRSSAFLSCRWWPAQVPRFPVEPPQVPCAALYFFSLASHPSHPSHAHLFPFSAC
jgi:hypothetical protein